jgi:alkanesulfonate monooxygenase SsuD/methylene tetrahydromethanopterin reductase-like flavin-dependent oxidoreductase (luciferase family)
MPVEFGLALTEAHPPAERLTAWMDNVDAVLPQLQGHFKSLWMTDHLFWGDQWTYEAWTVLSFLAAKWPQFDIGPMVIGQNYRNPGLLAKIASTLQVFSGGRLLLGVGAGWKEDEYHAYNYELPSPSVRLEQLADTLEILKRLWTQPGKVTYVGKHYAVHDAILEPKPNPAPPIVVGAKGDRMLRVVAKYADWWNLSDSNIDQYQERLGVLRRHCQEVGRDPSSIRLTWFGRLATGRNDAEVQARAVTEKRTYTTKDAFVGTPAQIVEQMRPFVDLGVDYFMLDVLGLPDADVIRLVLEEILPKVHA